MKEVSEIGIVGMGVMGKSLALNMAQKNIDVSVYNRHLEGKEERLASLLAEENEHFKNLNGYDSMSNFLYSLKSPKKILLMVTAGKPVDYVINDFLPFLKEGDIIIDGGNSYYLDTQRRVQELEAKGIKFIGLGISGGEEGALNGPALMPGGKEEAYHLVENILNTIAAKDKSDKPCSAYLGKEGAGHFVKMVHNGIEYAEMQLLAEVYSILKTVFNQQNEEISSFFQETASHYKGGFLSEISTDIFKYKEGDEYLIDKILDKSGHKGTGGWTVSAGVEFGAAVSTIAEAVAARYISSEKEYRQKLSKQYSAKINARKFTKEHSYTLQQALLTARIINHIVGFSLISKAARDNLWDLKLSEVARIWTNGCIIRSELMEEMVDLLNRTDDWLGDPEIVKTLTSGREHLTEAIYLAFQYNCSVPVKSAALNYLNMLTTDSSPANLIQAQRDYFGAHTYQRIDMPKEEFFHNDWKK